MVMRASLLYLSLATLFLETASAFSQMDVQVLGPYQQPISGMNFPERVDLFERRSISKFKSDGSDVDANYILPVGYGRKVLATVYSFPSPPLVRQSGESIEDLQTSQCGAVAAQIIKDIQVVTPTSQRLSANLVSIQKNGIGRTGYHAAFLIPSADEQHHGDRTISEVFVFCYVGARWTMEYRFSYPEDLNAKAGLLKFINDLPWSQEK